MGERASRCLNAAFDETLVGDFKERGGRRSRFSLEGNDCKPSRVIFFFFGSNNTRRGEIYSSGHIWATCRAGGRCCCLLVSVKSAGALTASLLLGNMRKQSSTLIDEWGVGMARPTLLSPPLLIPNPAGVCRDLINHYWPWRNGSSPPLSCVIPALDSCYICVFVCFSPQSERPSPGGETINIADESSRTLFSGGPPHKNLISTLHFSLLEPFHMPLISGWRIYLNKALGPGPGRAGSTPRFSWSASFVASPRMI